MGFCVATTIKGTCEGIGLPVNRNLPFLHYLKQGGLGFGRCPVDLIDQHDIAEDGSLFKLEGCFLRIEYRSTDHITGHEVRGKLDTGKTLLKCFCSVV